MASHKLFPAREGDFNGWSNHYSQTLIDNAQQYFLTDTEVEELRKLQSDWDQEYSAAIKAADLARAATESKNTARAALEELVRNTAKRIMADNRISNAQRKDAGLPVHKATRTPVPKPTSSPRGQVVSTNRLEHGILVTDANTPTKRSKPAGVIGCEVMLRISETQSLDPKDYRLVGLWTKFPEVVEFQSEDAGKTAHYLFRWFNTKGEKGPWSDVASATIPAV